MKILVIGNGGREHALVWKLRQSSRVSEIFCVPGNGGICQEAACMAGDPKNVEGLLNLAHQLQPDITVVGPELPLSLGLVDEFKLRGLPVFGPTQAAAQLESSKSFAKEFMQRHQIPTAHYAVCHSEQELHKSLGLFSAPLVVKADGLAAGKGVCVCDNLRQALEAIDQIMVRRIFGQAGDRLIIE
ncbi:MAG TPA: phosphoribosylamine--glycine ligase, partial [Candidatus Angelobacter sp.]|nr:phosphoribosylamine--glycine ligase [Candidatus Angelobacter sp.]